MAKPRTLSQLKKQADTLHSQYVRLRDSTNGYGQCITCGRNYFWKDAQCGHFVSRKTNTLRYDEENTNLQCVGCNMFKAGEQYAYSKALDLKYGDGTAEKLHAQRFDTHKFTRSELEEIIHDRKEAIKFYENDSNFTAR